MNSRSVAIFAILVAAIVGVAIWFLNSEHAPHYSPTPDGTSATPKPADNSIPPNSPSSPRPRVDPVKPAPNTPNTPPVAKTPPQPQPITEDDIKIDNILRAYPGNTDQDHTNTAQALINAIPTLGAEGKVEAMQHVTNLLSDEEWKRASHIWKNPAFGEDVIEILATDLMNRDHTVMLPAMLEAIKMPNHPHHEEAKTTLEVFLDEDYGDDIGKWEKATKEYLRKEAAEEAAALQAQPPQPVVPPQK